MIFDKSYSDETACNPLLHTAYRSVLGKINWLQSRTQFHLCYGFSRCASAATNPTIADVKALNKLVRTVKSRPLTLNFWPLRKEKGPLRIVAYPDASYRNNDDKSSQQALVIFIAEARSSSSPDARGSLIDFESHKIKRTTMSTTVAELTACMRSHGHSQFIRGLWMDLTGEALDIHIRTDANNLVTTARTTHLPEQKETIHMISMLRKESNSGSIHDLAHTRTVDMLADCLTKSSVKPDNLITAVERGVLVNVDSQPSFRNMVQHKAYLTQWCICNLDNAREILSFFGEEITQHMHEAWYVS